MGKNYLITALAVLAAYQITLCQVTYNYTGSVQTYTVPCNVDSIRIQAWGAGGGGAGADSRVADPGGEGGWGGGGAYVNSTVAVTPGDIIKIYVAGGGGGGTGCTAGTGGGLGGFGYGIGGNGANSGPGGCSGAGGAGGGSSAVFDSTTSVLLIAAAGGGGGGGGGYNQIPEAGGGGGQNGNYNASAGERVATAGGNTTVNGAAGGSTSSDGGGGGGGGGGAINGGLGGSAPDCDCGAGAGGGGNSVGNIMITGNAGAPGDSTDAGLCNGCARGGAGAVRYDNYTAPAGGNGIIIIMPVNGGGVFTAQAIPADTSVCRGSKVQLQATGGATYLWDPAVSLDSASSPDPVAIPDSTTIYFVAVKSGTCLDTASVIVRVLQGAYGIAGSIIPSLDSICAGNSVQLVDTGSYGTIRWQSSVDGVSFSDIPDALTDTLFNSSITRLTYYRVEANGGCSTDSSSAAVVAVNPVPVVSVTASKNIFCSGDSAQLCATGGFPSYEWNTGETGGANCIEVENAGNYYVTVTDYHSCTAESNHVPINVYPVPSVSILEKGNTFLSFGQVSYQWYLNGNPVDSATSPEYVANQAGSYTVEVTDTDGCTAVSTPLAITSLNSLTEREDILLYPNPTSGTWQLAVTTGLIGSAVELYDEQGRLVWKDEIRAMKNEIGDDGLLAGVYIMRILNAEGSLVRSLVKL